MPRTPIVLILMLFTPLTAIALWYHGYWGILAPHFQNFGEAQVLADLVIALSLVMVWMWQDAKATDRNPWPWILATLILGSFGPLGYLLARNSIDKAPQMD
jgi:hypothetical protein